MESVYCLLFFLMLIPALMITMGLIYIFKKDLAWRYVEWMLRYVKPQRTPEWERSATINGIILLVGGVVIIFFILSRLF